MQVTVLQCRLARVFQDRRRARPGLKRLPWAVAELVLCL
jgi:hypothetical protein